MRLRTFVVLAGLIASSLLFATTLRFSFKRLANYPAAFATYPRGINQSGQVAGFYQAVGGQGHAYLETASGFRTIEPPSVKSSYAEGINDAGMAVGGYCIVSYCPLDGAEHAFIYDHGKFTTLNYPEPGSRTAAYGINNLGEVVGGYCPTRNLNCGGNLSPSNHAFKYSEGQYTTVDYPGALSTEAFAINDSGDIVGYYLDNRGLHGFLYGGGVFRTNDVPNSGYTIPLGINNAGQVAGVYTDQNAITHGYIYQNGVFYTKIDVPGSTASVLQGISNSGAVTAIANVNPIGPAEPFQGTPLSATPEEPPN